MTKTLEAWSRHTGRGHGRGGVAKAVEALSRPWGRDQGGGGVAKAVGRGQGREGKA